MEGGRREEGGRRRDFGLWTLRAVRLQGAQTLPTTCPREDWGRPGVPEGGRNPLASINVCATGEKCPPGFMFAGAHMGVQQAGQCPLPSPRCPCPRSHRGGKPRPCPNDTDQIPSFGIVPSVGIRGSANRLAPSLPLPASGDTRSLRDGGCPGLTRTRGPVGLHEVDPGKSLARPPPQDALLPFLPRSGAARSSPLLAQGHWGTTRRPWGRDYDARLTT